MQPAAAVLELPGAVSRAEHIDPAQHTTLPTSQGCTPLGHRKCACHRRPRQPQGLGQRARVPHRPHPPLREPVVWAILVAGWAQRAPASACGAAVAGVAMLSDHRGRRELISAGLGTGPGRASKNRNTWRPPIYIYIYIYIPRLPFESCSNCEVQHSYTPTSLQ